MKKFVALTIFFIFMTLTCLQATAKAPEQESAARIDKGTFLKVICPVEISSNLADIGDEVTFINESDMYVGDINAVPRGTKIMGFVEDLKEPVQGTNAAIKFKINKMITPDNRVIPVNAYIYSENNNYIGGEQTPPMYYNKTPTYIEGLYSGVLQYTPSNIRYPGQHTIIKAGTELFVILMDDLKIN